MDRHDEISPARQLALDAALELQVVRARSCREWQARGRCEDAAVVAGGIEPMRARIVRLSGDATEIVGVSTAAESVDIHVESHRRNLRLVRRGTRMVSIFDSSTMTPEVRDFLAAETSLPYYVSYAPVQVRIFDRACVALEGPTVEGERSLLVLHGPRAVAAALRYVGAVRRAASRPGSTGCAPGLSARQRLVADLLCEGCRDDQIAGLLDVSVRTVRTEVAAIMAELGVTTRFAAGVRFAQIGTT